MKAFMTNGTMDFLLKLRDKHTELPLHIMSSGSGALAYYEGNEKNIFSAGRAYEAIAEKGSIHDKGYVVMNNIPVTEEGKPVFEDQFKKRQHQINNMPGFQAFRLLKPIKGNTYVVFTQWASEGDFDNWKNSDQFEKAHKDSVTKPPAYFLDRPFVTAYHMHDPNQEKTS